MNFFACSATLRENYENKDMRSFYTFQCAAFFSYEMLVRLVATIKAKRRHKPASPGWLNKQSLEPEHVLGVSIQG